MTDHHAAAAKAIDEARRQINLDIRLLGTEAERFAQWQCWGNVYQLTIGPAWINIHNMVQAWLLGGPDLEDAILTEPGSRIQFRFIGRRCESSIHIRLSMIGVENFDCLTGRIQSAG